MLIATLCGRVAADGCGSGSGLVTGFGAGDLEFPAELTTSAADTTTFAVSLLVGKVCLGAAAILFDDGGGFAGGLESGFGVGCLEFPADLASAADTTTFAVSLLVGKVCLGAAAMLFDDGGGFAGGLESGFGAGCLEFPADLTLAVDTTTFAVLLVGKVCCGAAAMLFDDGGGFAGGQASPCPGFELGSAVAGRGGWAAATRPGDDGDGFGCGLESGTGGGVLESAIGLTSAAGTPSSAVSLSAGNSSQGGKTIAGADGSGLGDGQASPCAAFKVGSAELASSVGWGAATMPAEDGDGFGCGLESGTGGGGVGFAVGLISGAGTLSSALLLSASNSSQGGEAIAGADGRGLAGGLESGWLGFAVGLISTAVTPSSAVSLLAGNSSQDGKTIAGADGSRSAGGQAPPCPAFELGSGELAGSAGWGVATMPGDDGDGFGSEGRLAARLVAAARTRALTASLRGKVCRSVP